MSTAANNVSVHLRWRAVQHYPSPLRLCSMTCMQHGWDVPVCANNPAPFTHHIPPPHAHTLTYFTGSGTLTLLSPHYHLNPVPCFSQPYPYHYFLTLSTSRNSPHIKKCIYLCIQCIQMVLSFIYMSSWCYINIRQFAK